MRQAIRFSLLSAAAIAIAAALGAPAQAAVPASVRAQWEAFILPEKPPVPKANPMTPAKVELGRQLYFDPRLSSTGKVSCNSCHDVMAGGEDNRATSLGVFGKTGGRSAPTVWNSAFLSVQFWDGRAASLEEQAKGPMVNPVEMGNPNHDVVVKRLAGIPGYVKQFDAVYGKNSLNIDNVAKAIAAYERTLVTPNSAFDRYVKGDEKALTPAAKRGMDLVQQLGCISCHSGQNFSGPPMPEGTGFYQRFPRIPSAYDAKYQLKKDLGRYEATRTESDRHMWRVPTWRNVAKTAPYFHNGSVKTLDEAVRVMAKSQLNTTLTDGQTKDIVAFLSSLTGEFPKQKAPKLPV
ncbi:cytochrome-c peroxidase [bacterium]|nr:cytochrome-c peroxidase [bacterium]